MKLTYRTEPPNRAIVPTRHPDLKSLVSIWNLVAPGLYEELSFIQIDCKYIVSLGAHFTHANALFSIAHPIGYQLASEICSHLSFMFDTPITTDIGFKKRDRVGDLRALRRILRMQGYRSMSDAEVQQIFTEKHEFMASAGDNYIRVLPFVPSEQKNVLAFDLCLEQHLADAMLAYQQALFSIEPAGQILNYWRVLEATSRSATQRRSLLSDLATAKLQPVKAVNRLNVNDKPINLISRYNRFIAPHIRKLIATHGSPEGVMDFLYHHRRNPSAHGERNVLRVAGTTTLSEIYCDAMLLKLLARLSIQRYFDRVT